MKVNNEIVISSGEDEGVGKCCWVFDPSYNRFTAVLLIGTFCFAICFCFDIPGSLQVEIENTFGLNASQFEYLYSVCSIPNIFLCFIGGILVDRVFGVNKSAFICCSIGLVGQIILTVGGFCKAYWVMLLGRFIYGIGGSSVSILSCYFIVVWFEGKEMNCVFGLAQTVARLGTSAVFLASSALHDFAKHNISPDYQIGLCLSPGIMCFLVIGLSFFVLCILGKANGKDGGVRKRDDNTDVPFRDTINLSLPMWLVTVIISGSMTSVTIFNSLAQRLLSEKFGIATNEASKLATMFNVIGALSAPIPGFIVDMVGRELGFNLFGHILGISAHIILAFTSWNPYISLSLFAISFATLNSCTWPLVSRVVHGYQLGSAYGIAQSGIDLCLSVFTVFAGYLLDKFGQGSVVVFFLVLYLIGLSCVLMLWYIDTTRGNGKLNMSAGQRKIYIQEGIEQSSSNLNTSSTAFAGEMEYETGPKVDKTNYI